MINIVDPTYAPSTMAYFKVYFYGIGELKWRWEFQKFILKIWSRLLDDCQKPQKKNNIKTLELLSTLNSLNEAIQFSVDSSGKEVPFFRYFDKRNTVSKKPKYRVFSSQYFPKFGVNTEIYE